MSLLIAALIGLVALAVSRQRQGPLYHLLVEAPARGLNLLTWKHVAIAILAVILMQLTMELAVPHLALLLAVDIVGWIDVAVAAVVVTRLAPSWRAMKEQVERIAERVARPRTPRARRLRRPARPSEDADPAFGFAFA